MAGGASTLNDLELVKKLASANTQFGLDLYKTSAKGRVGSNIFLSPFSISAALGMTHLGARGRTLDQMNLALKWSDFQDSVHSAFEDYLGLLRQKQESFVLKTANRLYINDKRKILEEFLKRTQKHYGAKAVLADFVGNGSGEADKINAWVEEETNGKITNLIAGGIDPLTAMIIVNAIYFKGNWDQQFDPSKTSKGDFKVKPGETVKVDMMQMNKKFNYGRSRQLNCSILELPYLGKDLSMFFLLPNDDYGLDSLENNLNQESLTEALKQVLEVKVDIRMPRFIINDKFVLNDILMALGMTDAFDETKADLSGMDGTRLLFISKALHKSFLEVNEEGSEAAAATAVVVMTRSLPRMESFNADHPFLFLIRDNRTDVVLFLGRLVKPDGPPGGASGGSPGGIKVQRKGKIEL